jgi:hypothetical protein
MLDKDTILEDGYLDAPKFGSHHHDAVHALATGQKLALSDDRATSAGITPITTTLLLCLESGGTFDSSRLIAEFWHRSWLANTNDRVGGVIAVASFLAGTAAGAAANGAGLIPVVGATIICRRSSSTLVLVAARRAIDSRRAFGLGSDSGRRLEQQGRGYWSLSHCDRSWLSH